VVALLVAGGIYALSRGTVGASDGFAGLDGRIDVREEADVAIEPGRTAGWIAVLGNGTGRTITLYGARVLPLAGFRVPRPGRYLAVDDNPNPRDLPGWGFIGWPPPHPVISLAPLRGYRVSPGRDVKIIYTTTASELGRYADAGIAVTVGADGKRVVVDVLEATGLCVEPDAIRVCATRGWSDYMLHALAVDATNG
jgi:hypothetical protein